MQEELLVFGYAKNLNLDHYNRETRMKQWRDPHICLRSRAQDGNVRLSLTRCRFTHTAWPFIAPKARRRLKFHDYVKRLGKCRKPVIESLTTLNCYGRRRKMRFFAHCELCTRRAR